MLYISSLLQWKLSIDTFHCNNLFECTHKSCNSGRNIFMQFCFHLWLDVNKCKALKCKSLCRVLSAEIFTAVTNYQLVLFHFHNVCYLLHKCESKLIIWLKVAIFLASEWLTLISIKKPKLGFLWNFKSAFSYYTKTK